MASEGSDNQQLRAMLSQVLSTQSGMVDKLDRLTAEVVNINSRLAKVEKMVEIAAERRGHGGMADSGASVDSVRRFISGVNSSNERFRLVFHGMEETPGEEVHHKVRQFIHEKLGLDKTRCQNMPLLAHRMLRMAPTDVHSPVLVVFRMMGDFEDTRKRSLKFTGELRKINMGVTTLNYFLG